jgi:hypothetical protein
MSRPRQVWCLGLVEWMTGWTYSALRNAMHREAQAPLVIPRSWHSREGKAGRKSDLCAQNRPSREVLSKGNIYPLYTSRSLVGHVVILSGPPMTIQWAWLYFSYQLLVYQLSSRDEGKLNGTDPIPSKGAWHLTNRSDLLRQTFSISRSITVSTLYLLCT